MLLNALNIGEESMDFQGLNCYPTRVENMLIISTKVVAICLQRIKKNLLKSSRVTNAYLSNRERKEQASGRAPHRNAYRACSNKRTVPIISANVNIGMITFLFIADLLILRANKNAFELAARCFKCLLPKAF